MFVNEQLGIFVNSETARFHFSQLETVDGSLKFRWDLFCRDLDQWCTGSYSSRIAAFHVPFALGPDWTTWIAQFEQVYSLADHIFVFCSELHEKSVNQLIQLDRPNVSIFISGVINDYQFEHACVRAWQDWFHTSSEFYARIHPDFLDSRLNPYVSKSKSFDILLGNQRPHRDYVHNYIVQQGLNDCNIMTYVYYSHRSLINNDQFILEMDDVELDPARSYTHSVDSVKYHGRWITVSQIVPINIYNQTAYSLVAETNYFNCFNFYTEKIVKPMLARRLFVVIAGKNYLANLRAMGFQTFGNIIDETYDTVDDDQQRWCMAMDQVRLLCQLDQTSILDAVKPIAEHNYGMIAKKNWYQEFLSELAQQLQVLWPQRFCKTTN